MWVRCCRCKMNKSSRHNDECHQTPPIVVAVPACSSFLERMHSLIPFIWDIMLANNSKRIRILRLLLRTILLLLLLPLLDWPSSFGFWYCPGCDAKSEINGQDVDPLGRCRSCWRYLSIAKKPKKAWGAWPLQL
jgi:hypothetical protein